MNLMGILRLLMISLLITSISTFAFAQDDTDTSDGGFAVRAFGKGHAEHGSSAYGLRLYNFFRGPDAEKFKTTIKGFGSGFILDVFNGTLGTPLLSIGWPDHYLGIGAKLNIQKYRFKDPLIMKMDDNGEFVHRIDDDPSREYDDSFFGYTKSKLVLGSATIPAGLSLKLGPIYFSGGGYADVLFGGKHKLKYKEDGERKKEKIGGSDFNEFPFNKIRYGVFSSLSLASGYGIHGSLSLTPFFKTSEGPEVYQGTFSVSIPIFWRRELYDS